MSTNETTMVTESLYSSSTATLHSIPISSVVTSHSTSLTSLSSTSLLITHSSTTIQSSTGDNNTTTLIAAVISTVLILLVVSILVIIIVSVLMYKRRKRLTLKVSSRGDGNHDTKSTTKKDDERMSNNPSYQPQGTHTYKYYQHYSYTVTLHEEPINSTITDNPSYGVNKRRNQGIVYILPVPLNIINDIVYIHTGIESVYDEPIQASNTTITDNPSYGVNKRRNQGSELKHY